VDLPALKARWYYILVSLAAGPRHGQAVARDVQQLSDGRVRLWPATLYGSLQELVDRRWIEELDPASQPDGSERKRYYSLTRAGRAVLAAETDRLSSLVRAARAANRRGHA
jgi:DNA-binding PadR family transcriptional regulator